MTTALRLHYHSIPTISEELFANESINIKHSRGIFQRSIIVDANKERLSVSFNVRKFFGPTDFCGYGGLRMFNHLYAAVNRNQKDNILQVHVPYSIIKNKSHRLFQKNSSYYPICTNDSIIFQQKFYLDFGKTFFVFYDFSPMWNIDVTLSVHASEYNALYDFELNYCNHNISVYIFNDFFVNCIRRFVKLRRQVPFILQWSRESTSNREKRYVSIKCIWPGIMDLTINQNYRNLKVFNSKNELCAPNKILRIAGVSNMTSVLLGANIQNQKVPDAKSLIVASSFSNCYSMDHSSYAVIINPSLGNSRCMPSRTDFTVRGSANRNTNYQIASEGCISLDATMSRGTYMVYLIEQSFNIPMQDNYIYYSVVVKEGCNTNAGVITYFYTVTSTFSRYVHFKLPQLRYQHIFYDFGCIRSLRFHLEHFLVECVVYIEFTSSAPKQNLPPYQRRYFKVHCINAGLHIMGNLHLG